VHGRAAAATELTLRAGAASLAGDTASGGIYDEAIAAWRSLRLPLHLAMCLIERHRLLARAEGGTEADGLAEAEAILQGLGARGLLRTIRPVASSGSP
jgi:hypothetical protein